jgi:hypothetical protein
MRIAPLEGRTCSRMMMATVSMTYSAQSGRHNVTNTNALNEMLKRVQYDKKRHVIPNLFRNLEFGNDNKLIAFVLS